MKQNMSKSNDRKSIKLYTNRPHQKQGRDSQKSYVNFNTDNSLKSSKHVKSKSNISLKGLSEFSKTGKHNMYHFISPTAISSLGKATHKFSNSISNPLDVLQLKGDSQDSRTHFKTIDSKKVSLNGKYKPVGHTKTKSTVMRKNQQMMEKYSREANRKYDHVFSLPGQTKGTYPQPKGLKLK